MALTDNLVSYWKLDGNSNDSVASNNGTDTAITYSVGNGKIVQGAGFNGTTSTFTVPIVMGTVGSFNLWYKRADTSTANDCMFGSTKIAVADYIRINPTASNTVQFICENDVVSGSVTTDTNWHMATIVWDASTAWKGYVDGTLVATGTGVKNPTNTGYNIRAGITADGTGIASNTYYNGAIDEIGYWNRRISESEITQLYNGGAGLAYPFTSSTNATRLTLLNVS